MSGLCLTGVLLANAISGEPNDRSSTDSRVLARTGPQTITDADIDFLLARFSKTDHDDQLQIQVPRPLSSATQATAIELLALQRQALATLIRQQQAASTAEIDNVIRARAPPDQSDWSLAQIIESYSNQFRIEPEKVRDSIDFKISWTRYLEHHLTEENLRKHFDTQHRRFDGTRFNIDLLTITVPVGESLVRSQARQRLEELRSQLSTTQVNWEQLDKRDGDQADLSVSRQRWVRGTGDLVPRLITPLLEMDIDQLSQPIHTATGVHLVHLIDVEVGSYVLSDVRGDVRTHMLLYLLEHLAKQSAEEWPLLLCPD